MKKKKKMVREKGDQLESCVKEKLPDAKNSPGTETGTRPTGKRTQYYPGEHPPARHPGSAAPPRDTAAPWLCAYPGRTEGPATAGWERTAAVPRAVYRCSAAASEQAAVLHYHRDLENRGCDNINQQ